MTPHQRVVGINQYVVCAAGPCPDDRYHRYRLIDKGDGHQIWRTQRVQVNVASLRLFLRSSTGPSHAFEPQSLGRVRDRFRIAEGPNAIDAATQRRHFGFRLRLVDKLQPIGGGSGRGHPLSGTWETWMALNVNWLRQCRRAGLYEQGKAIYEKGGLNLANLTDEQQIEAEDDYRICVRRGRDEETKPRR